MFATAAAGAGVVVGCGCHCRSLLLLLLFFVVVVGNPSLHRRIEGILLFFNKTIFTNVN